MDVELLVVPDCPKEQAATTLLRTALDDLGLTTTAVRTTVIDTQYDAELRGFTGSPTILIDGTDAFGGPMAPPALACRVYPGPTGASGVPDLRSVRRALTRAAQAAAEGARDPGS